MPSNFVLRIPASALEGLRRFRALVEDDPRALAGLKSALERSEPSISDAWIRNVVQSNLDVTNEAASELSTLFVTLSRMRSLNDVTASQLASAVAESAGADQRLQGGREEWDAIVPPLAQFLEAGGAFELFLKSTFINYEHDRLFEEARVLTDMRPVFDESASAQPSTWLITHKLRLSFVNRESDRSEAIFIALDARDLESLGGALRRAAEKEETLRSSFAAKGMQVLRLEPEGE